MSNNPSKAKIITSSIIKSTYDILFVLLPALTWVLVTLSLGGSSSELKTLSAWPFAALSLFSSTLKDGISAFHRDESNDKRQRELIVTASIIGLVLSTVLLTLSIVSTKNSANLLFPYFYEFVYLIVIAGMWIFFVTKSIFYQRADFNHYV